MVKPAEPMPNVPAFDDAPTDPRLPFIELPDEVVDPVRGDLPPGFDATPKWANGHGEHPATNPSFTTLTFRTRPDPWYRTNAFKIVLLLAGFAVAVAGVVALLWPSSTPAPRDAAPPAPAPSSSTAPSTIPSQVLPPPPPVEAPPPPPPPPESDTAQAPVPQYRPRYSSPTPTRAPRIDVTRAPMSATPGIRRGQPR